MMSGSPPPIWGEAVGSARCASKGPADHGVVIVTFVTERHNGTVVLPLREEDANYFVVGEQYALSLTKVRDS